MTKLTSILRNSILASLLCLAFLSFVIVVLRYCFGFGRVWLQESLIYIHSYVFMFGTLLTLSADKHVRVDVLYNTFKNEKKKFINFLGFLLLSLPFCLTIIYTSFSYVLDSWKWLEKSSDAGGLPLVFILKSFIPIFALLVLVEAFKNHLLTYIQQKKKGA